MRKVFKKRFVPLIFAILLSLSTVCVAKSVHLSNRLELAQAAAEQERALRNQAASELEKAQNDNQSLKDRLSSLDSQIEDLKKENQKLQQKYAQATRQKASTQDKGKVAYLTFDDGPSIYTDQLLDALRASGVHATFFVVGTNVAKYPDIVRKAQSDGNAVGIHCYNHAYSVIYASQTAFFDDYSRMQKLLADTLGTYSSICRFPGGTANTVSDHYGGAHFMQNILPQVISMGITPFDWNVSAGDAEGPALSADKVTANIVNQAKKYNHPVILCHDIKKTTVEAIPSVIRQLKDLGYEFDLLSTDAPACQQKPA